MKQGTDDPVTGYLLNPLRDEILDDLFGVQNSLKSQRGQLKGLQDPNLMAVKEASEKRLRTALAKIPAKINLIPFNPWPGAPYECSDWEQIEKFAEVVNRAGYASPVRSPRGRDIMAACGQLRSESVRQRANARLSPAGSH